jgi:hypothetical protein
MTEKPSRLTILEIVSGNTRQGKIAHCICSCGNKHSAPLKHVNNKSVKSCGCLRRELAGNTRIAQRNAELEKMAEQREAFHRISSWPVPGMLA